MESKTFVTSNKKLRRREEEAYSLPFFFWKIFYLTFLVIIICLLLQKSLNNGHPMSYTSQTLTKTRYLSSVIEVTSIFGNNAIGLTARPNLIDSWQNARKSRVILNTMRSRNLAQLTNLLSSILACHDKYRAI